MQIFILVANVAERLEEVTFLNIKPRRLLKGNQAKMLCCDWSPDKRHIVSSSQVHHRILQMCLIFNKICLLGVGAYKC